MSRSDFEANMYAGLESVRSGSDFDSSNQSGFSSGYFMPDSNQDLDSRRDGESRRGTFKTFKNGDSGSVEFDKMRFL